MPQGVDALALPLARSRRPVELILFDLDGTLVDASGGITTTINRVLAKHGLFPCSIDAIRYLWQTRPIFGQRMLLKRGSVSVCPSPE